VVHANPTAADGSVSAAPFTVTLASGPTTVQTAFAGDSTYDASSDSDAVSVLKEDCTLAYTGDTLVPPLKPTNLRVQFGEGDAYAGDWAGKIVTFTVTDASLATSTYTATTDTAGVAAREVSLNANVYAVMASFAGDGFYNPCETSADVLVTAEAAGSKVTGGGWFSNTAGRTSFGFNAIPQTDGTYKGQIQIRSNAGKNTFQGNSIGVLTSPSNTSVRWSGSGRWNGNSGYTYVVTVVDNGQIGSKKSDTIDITIYRTGDSSHPVFTSNGAQALKGGNITIH